jgi:hypothetical protein
VVVFCVDPNYYDKPTGVVVLLLLYWYDVYIETHRVKMES